MNIILLSGGSGKRLWPLSNDIRSKQFIKIFKQENGEYESMVQRVYRQIRRADPSADVTIATSKTQVSAIHNQLGEGVGISVEPYRRDTFPAIALATAYLVDIKGMDPEEVVVVCPVDPFVEDAYFEALKGLSDQAAKGEANLVLMGIKPTYPSEKYGYIIPESSDVVSGVSTFKEKPDAKTAEKYIAQGALWNGGVFAYKLKYVLNKAHELIDFTDYNDLFSKYETLTKISFDYAVVEQETKIKVMRFAGQWKDLGTWNTLTEAMEEYCVGEAMMNENCSNVHIVNEMSIPVLAMGLHDVIISASPEGILVADKEQSSYIKPFVDKIDQQVKNSHWSDTQGKAKPFLLKPAGKDYLWGGNRLTDDYAKEMDMCPLAETWECSTHPDGPSVIANGEFAGKTLAWLLEEHPEYMGTHPERGTLPPGQLPILIKMIDAQQALSVQVHPDDAYAMQQENGQLGKTEMWYVLDAAKDARLIYGLHHDVTAEELRESIEEGTVEKYLQKVPVQKNDLFFIDAGTIHAIGAGVVIAEIQENSNLTYRLYDYDREDKNGRKRPLHVDKALKVANLKASLEPSQPLRVLKYRQGCASEVLCRCKYFEVHRMLINTESCRQMVGYQADSISFRVLLCLEGCGTIFYEKESFNYFKGDCIFVPANSVKMHLHGRAQFLDVRC